MGRQTTNYKRRAIFQLQEIVKELKKDPNNTLLVNKLNKIKSTIEKIRNPQTRKAIKNDENKKNNKK